MILSTRPTAETYRFVANLALGSPVPGSGVRITTDGVIGASAQVPTITELYRALNGSQALMRGPLRGEMALDAAELRAWNGYSLEIFAMLQPADQIPPDGRLIWTINWLDEGMAPTRALPVRQWARFGDDPVKAELLWLPGESAQTTVRGDVEDASDGALRRARKGLRLIHRTSLLEPVGATIGQGGRPEDTGDYDDASEPRFFEELGKAAHDAVRAGEPLSYASLGRHGLGDRRTAKKYVERFKYDLQKIETEAVRCTQRLFMCQFHVRRMAEFKGKRP